ncbi:MAG: HlyD family efflux transporter periplasmic adaptor subunit [Chloroflexota bacterium]|nr:HlyD family efflux transporter periplasmic adaptor subunit [Chloroflexota bacterium]
MRGGARFVPLLLVGALQLSACSQGTIAEAEDAPAVVAPLGDSGVNRVTLTDRAAARLGIKIAAVRDAVVGRTRVAPAEVVTSAVAASLAATAPDAGTISAPEGGSLPAVGTRLRAGDTVLLWRALVAVGGQTPATEIKAPKDSVLVRLDVAAGQIVAAGQALFQLTDPTEMWVRVPLSDNDLKKVDRQQAARVFVGTGGTGPGLSAHVVASPGSGDAPDGYTQAALYYVPDRKDHGLTLGERARVELPLVGTGIHRPVIPYEAVLYDLTGGSWIYTNPQPLVFVRARVEIDYVEADQAVLASGPAIGTAIVTTGAAELHGAEFGVGE